MMMDGHFRQGIISETALTICQPILPAGWEGAGRRGLQWRGKSRADPKLPKKIMVYFPLVLMVDQLTKSHRKFHLLEGKGKSKYCFSIKDFASKDQFC